MSSFFYESAWSYAIIFWKFVDQADLWSTHIYCLLFFNYKNLDSNWNDRTHSNRSCMHVLVINTLLLRNQTKTLSYARSFIKVSAEFIVYRTLPKIIIFKYMQAKHILYLSYLFQLHHTSFKHNNVTSKILTIHLTCIYFA